MGPFLSPRTHTGAKHLVEEIGCDSMDDLALVQEKDLAALKPMQIRKLMLALKKLTAGKLYLVVCIFF